jgi:hypothetical protein
MTPEIEAAVAAALANAYAAAYAFVYYAAVAVGIVGVIGEFRFLLPHDPVFCRYTTDHAINTACFCVKDYDPYFTNHIPRQIYKGGKDEVGALNVSSTGSDTFESEEDQESVVTGKKTNKTFPPSDVQHKETV